MLRDWVALIVSIGLVSACFWYVFLRKAPPAVVVTPPTPEAWAWHRVCQAVQRAAEALSPEGADRALLDALHAQMKGNGGTDEPGFLRADQALQYALGNVTSDRIARACLCEAQARMTTLRIHLAEKHGWFGGVAVDLEIGPPPALKTMRQIADRVELAARLAPEKEAPALRTLHKALPTQAAPTVPGVLRVEEELLAALERLGDTLAAEHLRAAIRMVAEVKTQIPGAVQASRDAPAA